MIGQSFDTILLPPPRADRRTLSLFLCVVVALLPALLFRPQAPPASPSASAQALVLEPANEVVAWRDGHTRHYALGGRRFAAVVSPAAAATATMAANRALVSGSLVTLESEPGSGEPFPGLFVAKPACVGHLILDAGERSYWRAYFNFPLPTLPANVGAAEIVDARFYAAPDPRAHPSGVVEDPAFAAHDLLRVPVPVTVHPMSDNDWIDDIEDETPPAEWPPMGAAAEPVFVPVAFDHASLVKYNPASDLFHYFGSGWYLSDAVASAYGSGAYNFGVGVRLATDAMEGFYHYEDTVPGMERPSYVCLPVDSPYISQTGADGDPLILDVPAEPGVALTIVYELPLLSPGDSVQATVPSIETEETYVNQNHQYALPAGGPRWRIVSAHGNASTGDPLPRTPLELDRTAQGVRSTLVVSDQSAPQPQYVVISPDVPHQDALVARISPATTPDDLDHASKAYRMQLSDAVPSPAMPAPGESLTFALPEAAPLPAGQELDLTGGTTVEIEIPLGTQDHLNDLRVFPPNAGVAALTKGGAALRPGPDGVFEIEFQVAEEQEGTWLLAVSPGATAALQATVTVCANEPDTLRFPVDGECVELRRPDPAGFNAGNLQTVGNVRVYSPAGFDPPSCDPTCETLTVEAGANVPVMPLVSAVGEDNRWVALKGGTATLQPNQDALTIAPGTRLVLADFSSADIVALPVIAGGFTAETGAAPRLTPATPPLLLVDSPLPAEDGDGWAYEIDLTQGRLVASGDLTRAVQPTADEAANTLFFEDAAWSVAAAGGPSLESTLTLKSVQPTIIHIGVLQLRVPGEGCAECWVFEHDPATADPALPAVIPRFQQVRFTQATLAQPATLGGAKVTVQGVIRNEGAAATEEEGALHCGAHCLYVRGPADALHNPDFEYRMPDVIVQDDLGMMAYVAASGAVYPLGPNAPENVDISFNFEAFGGRVQTRDGVCPGLRDPLDPETEPEPVGGKTTLIEGEAQITLPGVGENEDLSQSAHIGVSFTLCQSSLREVHLEFSTGPTYALPLGDSKLFLHLIGGTVGITPEAAQIALDIGTRSPTPAEASSVVFGRGWLILDTRGLVDIHANVTVQVLGPVGYAGTGHLWVGWAPLDLGFEVRGCLPAEGGGFIQKPNFRPPGELVEESSLCQDDPILYGMIRAHMWQGCGWQCRYEHLADDEELHFAGRFESDVNLPKGIILDWGKLKIPWKTVTVREADLAIGEFCTNPPCTADEWGVMGAFGLLGYKIGLYYDFATDLHFILGNANFCLIDEIGAGESCPEPAFAAPLWAAPQLPANSVAFAVPEGATSAIFYIAVSGPTPVANIYRPGGNEVDITDPDVTVTYEDTGDTIYYALAVNNPAPGAWVYELENIAPDTDYDLFFAANGAPALNYALQGPDPANQGDTVTIEWDSAAAEYADLRVSFYWEQRGPADQTFGGPIAERVPLSQGSVQWQMTGMGDWSGSSPIRVYARLENVSAAVIEACGSQTYDPDPQGAACSTMRHPDLALAGDRVPVGDFLYVDTVPPAPPVLRNVRAEGPTSAFVNWEANDEPDLAGYVVTCTQPGLTRQLRTVPAYPAAANLPEGAEVHGLNAGVAATCSVQAYDASANLSQPSSAGEATPTGSPPASPAAPSILGWSGGGGALQANWAATPGAAGYYLYLNALATPAASSAYHLANGLAVTTPASFRWPIDVGRATSHQFSDLPAGTYEIFVRSYDAQGRTSADSEHVTVTVQDAYRLLLPLVTKAE